MTVHNQDELKLAKWPFVASDVLLLGAAVLVVFQSRAPLEPALAIVCAATVGLGALLGVTPFVLEYRAWVRLTEADALLTAAGQLKQLEAVASQISAATGQWQAVQEHSTNSVNAAKQIAERMAAEVAAFTEFLKKANDAEKATLRLEVDKLRRIEGDWLQVLVRILDHVFALHLAAVRAGKPEVAEQIGMFQHACRDIARRVGLVLFEAQPGESFDDERHKSADEETPVPDDARVKETLAPGLAFQGKLVRPALVALEPPPNSAPVTSEAVEPLSSAEPEESAEPDEAPLADQRHQALL